MVELSAGQSKASVCILIHDDYLKEGNETFGVFLSAPNNTSLISGQQVMATVTILG